METFVLGVVVGSFVGYAIRSLISRRRHRRFQEQHGSNPRLYAR
jgi:NhaP-type Na+/H+ or K+/H+ antiporter